MMPYVQTDSFTLYLGDALEVVSSLPSGSVDCVVTSPPYFGLRDYGTPGQYGLESSPLEYVGNLRKLFGEMQRVLSDTGTLWLNIGDSYSAKRSYQVDQSKVQRSRIDGPYDTTNIVPAKNMLGIPWRLAFALQDDGWILRNDIIWHKPNAMPQSVRDRLSSRYEHIFLFSKSPRYYFDLDAIRVPYTGDRSPSRRSRNGHVNKNNSIGTVYDAGDGGRNPGDVWDIATRPFAEAHFAVYPHDLPDRCISAGCRPDGVVLDPFSGSGTTGAAALAHGRRYIGIDINQEYLDLSLSSDKRLRPYYAENAA